MSANCQLRIFKQIEYYCFIPYHYCSTSSIVYQPPYLNDEIVQSECVTHMVKQSVASFLHTKIIICRITTYKRIMTF